MKQQSRRNFIRSAVAGTGALPFIDMSAEASAQPLFRISLAQWTLVKDIRAGKLDNLDFAKVAADHQIEGLEYVNQFFMDKAKDEAYIAEMKKRAEDHGVDEFDHHV